MSFLGRAFDQVQDAMATATAAATNEQPAEEEDNRKRAASVAGVSQSQNDDDEDGFTLVGTGGGEGFGEDNEEAGRKSPPPQPNAAGNNVPAPTPVVLNSQQQQQMASGTGGTPATASATSTTAPTTPIPPTPGGLRAAIATSTRNATWETYIAELRWQSAVAGDNDKAKVFWDEAAQRSTCEIFGWFKAGSPYVQVMHSVGKFFDIKGRRDMKNTLLGFIGDRDEFGQAPPTVALPPDNSVKWTNPRAYYDPLEIAHLKEIGHIKQE